MLINNAVLDDNIFIGICLEDGLYKLQIKMQDEDGYYEKQFDCLSDAAEEYKSIIDDYLDKILGVAVAELAA